MSTHFHYVTKVDIEDCTLGQQKMTWVLMWTLTILNVDLNVVEKTCQHLARSSMST